MAIVSGRRAKRPDGGVYRNMRRQRFGQVGGGSRRKRGAWSRLLLLVVPLALVVGGAYFAWQRFRPH